MFLRSRLMNINDRIKNARLDTTRMNIIDALKAFQIKQANRVLALTKVKVRQYGLLPWFRHVDMRYSSPNVEAFAGSSTLGAIVFEPLSADDPEARTTEQLELEDALSCGVSLAQGQGDTGYAVGVLEFPRNAAWTVFLTVLAKENKKKFGVHGDSAPRADADADMSPAPLVDAADAADAVAAAVDADMQLQQLGATPAAPPGGDPFVTPASVAPGPVAAGSVAPNSDESAAVLAAAAGTSHYDRDFVTVRLGPDLSNMTYVGTYHYKVNPETASILYDIKFTVKSKQLAYRFDFSVTNDLAPFQLAVDMGRYEEYQVPDITWGVDPQHPERESCLSSYVSNLRIAETVGNRRETALLEELIKAEEANTEHWDSSVIDLGTAKRYDRATFMRLIKAELLIMIQRKEQEAADKLTGQSASVQVSGAGASETKADEESAKDVDGKLERSSRRFITRKRNAEQPYVDYAMTIIGQQVMVYDKGQNSWYNNKCIDCIVMWVENGCKAKVSHVFQRIDNRENNVGEPFEIDLKAHRYMVLALPPAKESDASYRARMARFKLNKRLLELDKEKARQTMRIQRRFYEFKVQEEKALEEERKKYRQKLRDNSEASARQFMMTDKRSKRLVKSLALKMDVVVKDADGEVNEARSYALALATVEELFIENRIEQLRSELRTGFAEQEAEVATRIERREEELDDLLDRLIADIEKEKEEVRQKIDRYRSTSGKVLANRIKFDAATFKKACPPVAYNCEHLRSKHWGNEYGNGQKCLDCGKEISTIFNEDHQTKGWGSATDPWINDALKRHRENEESFRFESSAELVKIEEERRRLEKERREMNEEEGYFFDFDGIKVMYEFDRRHRSEIKGAGIFRQGLQWTADELEQLERDNIKAEEARLTRLGLQVENNMTDFEPLHTIEDPPSTFRAQDERHKAQFHDMMFMIGRLNNFQKRIALLKEERIELQDERNMYAPVLEAMHFDIMRSEDTLRDLEVDLDRAGMFQKLSGDMTFQWELGKAVLKTATRDCKVANLACAGLDGDVMEARDAMNILHEETNTLLRTKWLLDTKTDALVERIEQRKAVQAELARKFYDAHAVAQATFFLQPGAPVITRYGDGYIVAHRDEDDMLLVTLPFCEPPARAWIRTREIFDVERGRQQGEGKLMGQEEVRSGKLRAAELLRAKRETFLMGLEEDVREIWTFQDFNKREDKETFEGFDKAIRDSYKVITSKRFARVQKEKVELSFKKYMADLHKNIESYNGPPSGKPHMPSKWDQFQKKKAIVVELKENFMKNSAALAEAEISAKLGQERSAWMANFLFENMMREEVNSMIEGAAAEAVKEGANAKYTAERVSGIMFPDPTWMQFGIYSSLAGMWRQRKDDLRRQIALKFGPRAGAAPKTGGDKAQALDEMRAKHEQALRRSKRAEQRRQLAMRVELEEEEKLARAFYKWEMKENLRERREMRTLDEDGKLMREAERRIMEAQQSAYMVVGTGGGARAPRKNGSSTKGGGGDMSPGDSSPEKSPSKRRRGKRGGRGNVGDGGGGGGGGGGGSGGGGVELPEENGMTEEEYERVLASMGYERRRDHLKEVALARRRREEDRVRMIVEDDRSNTLRAQWIIEDAQARVRAEFGKDDGSLDDDESRAAASLQKKAASAGASLEGDGGSADTDDNDVDAAVAAAMSASGGYAPTGGGAVPGLDLDSLRRAASSVQELDGEEMFVDLPFWMDTPRDWEDWTFLEQKQYVTYHAGVRKRRKIIERAIAREYRRLERVQEASLADWAERHRRTQLASDEAELKVMLAEEEMKEAESALVDLKSNQNKIRIYAKAKGDAELKARSELHKKEALLGRRERELNHALWWYRTCQRRQKYRDRLVQKVVDQCTWIDTHAISGFMQRFNTNVLFERLYIAYFVELAKSIAIRAETVATERALMRNQERLTINKAGIVDRVVFLKKHAKDQQRDELMRMRRSVLNQRFFPLNRKDVLKQRFGGWIRYFFYKRGMKEAFACKYEVLKRQLDIDRQFKAQLQSDTDDIDKKKMNVLQPRKANNTTNYTVMQRHRERANICKTCRMWYLETQNTSFACTYHPQQYGLFCPKSCPNPGLTPMCLSHRMRRWRCCDATREGAQGCSRRYHQPPDADPIYDKVMQKIEERDRDDLADVNERLDVARMEKYPDQLRETVRKQVERAEGEVGRERLVAERYNQLKWM